MAHVNVVASDLALDDPTLIEGLPGEGLIGKLAVDHLVETFGMEYYAGIYCEGVPSVAAYRTNDSAVRPPVQLYVDADRDLLALVSDVPVSPSEAPEFAACITDWLSERGVTPVYVSALSGADGDEAADARPREIYGLATGDGGALLDEAGIVPPLHPGFVSGPTGALLSRAEEVGLDGVGLVAVTDGEFPDLEAVRMVVEHGIEPVVGVDAEAGALLDRTEDVPGAVEEFARQMRDGSDESTRARVSPMFQ